LKLLLDSHTVYWAVYEPERLPMRAADSIADATNELFVSLATLWELSNKAALGRLALAGTSVETMIARIRNLGVTVLQITEPDVVAASSLPPHHLDPFDRMLVAQAQANSLVIVTTDPDIPKYDVETLWK
jgi:PIN domain nuclease of toxin-antitoxin system